MKIKVLILLFLPLLSYAQVSRHIQNGDTTTVNTQLNFKLNISDTTGMLAPYLDGHDTVAMHNDLSNVRTRLASDTAKYLEKADTNALRNDISSKQPSIPNLADTSKYLEKADTNALRTDITTKQNIIPNLADSSKYQEMRDTINMYNLILTKHDKAGFLNRTDATLSFNNSTRKFKITPTSSTFEYYANDTKYNRGADSIIISTTKGQHFIYYSPSNILTDDLTEWVINAKAAPIAVIYWDSTNSKGLIYDERHNASRDREWHEWAHHTIGTRYSSGFGSTWTLVTDTVLKMATGVIFDEDIEHTIISPTKVRIVYRNPGGASLTYMDSAKTGIGLVIAGALKYDLNGTLTSVSGGQYVNSYIYATNDINYPIYCLIGQNNHANTSTAASEALPTIPGLVNQEWKLLYRLTLKQVTTTFNIVVANTMDYRTAGSVPGASALSSTAGSVAVTPVGNISSTNVQGALEELDTEKIAYMDSLKFISSNRLDTAHHGILGIGDTSAGVRTSNHFSAGGSNGITGTFTYNVGGSYMIFKGGILIGHSAGAEWSEIPNLEFIPKLTYDNYKTDSDYSEFVEFLKYKQMKTLVSQNK